MAASGRTASAARTGVSPSPTPGLPLRNLLIATALVHLALSLYAGHFNGRALWCDEIWHVWGQSLSVGELLRCENIRRFDTQSPLAWIVQRPFVRLFGKELGGIVASGVAGVALLVAVVVAVRRLAGERAGRVALLLAGTHPLLLYYASEHAFYIYWAAATAWGVALVLPWLRDPFEKVRPASRWGCAVAMAGLTGLHFAGIFVWAGTVAASAAILWLRAGTGRRIRSLVRHLPWLVGPGLLLVPMYVYCQRITIHKTAPNWSIMGTALVTVAQYVSDHLVALTGGGVSLAGIVLLGAALAVALVLARSQASTGLFCAFFLLPVLPFLLFARLKGYFLPVTRYYLYALGPLLILMSLGVSHLLFQVRSRGVRAAVMLAVAVLVGLNLLSDLSVLLMRGRYPPYRDLLSLVAAMPPGRVVVNPNHYELSFLNGYYPIPNEGIAVAPCFTEEGAEARSEGLRRIWRLRPDALFFGTPDHYEQVRSAGVFLPIRRDFAPTPLQRLCANLRITPEIGYIGHERYILAGRTPEELRPAGDARRPPVIVPKAGAVMCSFRSAQDGRVAFALYGLPRRRIEFDVRGARGTDVTVDTLLYPAGRLRLTARWNGVTAGSQTLESDPPRGMDIRTRQAFEGFPSPAALVQNGMNIGLVAKPVALALGPLRLGGEDDTLTLENPSDAPYLLLGVQVREGRPSPAPGAAGGTAPSAPPSGLRNPDGPPHPVPPAERQ